MGNDAEVARIDNGIDILQIYLELRTQKFIQHNTRVRNVQQCYCITNLCEYLITLILISNKRCEV